jgi:hypothetical protein
MEKKNTNIDPFAVETVELRKPLSSGERTIEKLVFQAPTVKDLLAAGQYPEASMRFTFALMCSLCGEPAILLQKMIPEDWAVCMVIVNRTYQRFCGTIDLFEKKKDENENPTTAGIPPETSSETSAA